MATGAPVDNIVSLVDQAFLVEANKDLPHGLGQTLVHGETFAVPIAGGTQAFELVYNSAAFLLPPLPDALNKSLSAQIMPVQLFRGQLPFHHVLRGNAGMVGARYPKRIVTEHAVITHLNILQGIV